MKLNAAGMDYQQLNATIRDSADSEVELANVNGQRYIACAARGKLVTVHGTPGNGL